MSASIVIACFVLMDVCDTLNEGDGGGSADAKKLKVGNWFSECQYYQLENGGPKDEMMDVYIYNESKDNYQVPKDQLIDMYSGTLYESEEKVTRTEMVETLLNAKECVFTVTFRKKVQAKDIEDILSSIKTDA